MVEAAAHATEAALDSMRSVLAPPLVDYANVGEFEAMEDAFVGECLSHVAHFALASSDTQQNEWLRFSPISSALLRLTRGYGSMWCLLQIDWLRALLLMSVRSAQETALRLHAAEGVPQSWCVDMTIECLHVFARRVSARLRNVNFIVIPSEISPATPEFKAWAEFVQERMLAVAMATHPRLGAGSPLAALDPGLVQAIAVLCCADHPIRRLSHSI